MVRTIKELDLVEISVVSTPANPNAVFSLEKSVKSFFDETKENWKKLLEKKEDTPNEPTETHSEVDEPNDSDNVANEILKQEEVPGETPADPTAPTDETGGTDNETPVKEPEGKSLEEKELKELRSDIQTLSDAVASYKAVVVSMVEALDDQNRELKDLRSIFGTIPMRKGLVMNGREEKKEVGYITSLLQNAQ